MVSKMSFELQETCDAILTPNRQVPKHSIPKMLFPILQPMCFVITQVFLDITLVWGGRVAGITQLFLTRSSGLEESRLSLDKT